MNVDTGPVAEFVARRARRTHPVPLRSTSYEVEVLSGLAVVRAVRTFRNVEAQAIEATLTFPVPFDAAVTRIEATVDGRVLTGRASAKVDARGTYEDALDRGKAAVLHEELLRGLHMLSVGNVAPGAEIEVAATFVAPLARVGGESFVRIPTTVGQIYGELPLPDSDQLVTGAPAGTCEVSVTSASGTVLVNGAAGGRVTVPDNRAIEVSLIGGSFGDVVGRAADGRTVTLAFGTAPVGADALDVDVVLDVSGSMRERIGDESEAGMTKWDVARAGLVGAADGMRPSDAVKLWVFSDSVRPVGSGRGPAVRGLVEGAPFIGRGTEIGRAVSTVCASREGPDVLLVTDGRSGAAIDVQAAVNSGARFHVVLIGEAALEANVGYLAAMTGGQMFVARGAEADLAIIAALGAMRAPRDPSASTVAVPQRVVRRLGGAEIVAQWTPAPTDAPARDDLAAALGAFAMHLALPTISEAAAAPLAAAEGLVSHLTSIVLVDEAGESVAGVPASRKVALPDAALSLAPSAAGVRAFMAASPMMSHAVLDAGPTASLSVSKGLRTGGPFRSLSPTVLGGWDEMRPSDGGLDEAIQRVRSRGGEVRFPADRPILRPYPGMPANPMPTLPPMNPIIEDPFEFRRPATPSRIGSDVESIARSVDWDTEGPALASGDLSKASVAVAAALRDLAIRLARPELAALVARPALDLAVAVVARAAAGRSRTAARIARSILAGVDDAALAAALRKAGV